MDIIETYLRYYEGKNYKRIDSASLFPENDKTSLFVMAGIQPLIPYFSDRNEKKYAQIVNCQKCIRMNELDKVGDAYHHTFFEMLGNWSFDKFSREISIELCYDFLVNYLGLKKERMMITIFSGNDLRPLDEETMEKWIRLGIDKKNIVLSENSWWGPIQNTGYAGPCTKILYKFEFDEKRKKEYEWIELWNIVFVEFEKKSVGQSVRIEKSFVDSGVGVERLLAVSDESYDDYLTEAYFPIIERIELISKKKYEDCRFKKNMRIIADHIRAVVMIICDDPQLKPSNTEQGYILRKLIRRIIRNANELDLKKVDNLEQKLVDIAIITLKKKYPEVEEVYEIVIEIIREEKIKFEKAILRGKKIFLKIKKELEINNLFVLTGEKAYYLYDTFGLPIEIMDELAQEQGIVLDIEGYEKQILANRRKSQSVNQEKHRYSE